MDGLDLIVLDAGVAHCVQTVLAGRRLGPADTGLMRAAEAALGRLGSLAEQERPYVERLCAPAVLVRIGQGVARRARVRHSSNPSRRLLGTHQTILSLAGLARRRIGMTKPPPRLTGAGAAYVVRAVSRG
ncbi:hypothetical protein [Geodermatophilus sp. URMC 62]|uniref:hypothetical protein n=1 Tax=Geodermatophilus sp. URMC 62 TaxID=3423414 RepID=UPI00406C52EA